VAVGTIFTVAVLVIVPPGPVTVMVYVVFVEGETPIEPLRAVLPIAGLKLTAVALVVLQLKVLVPPRLMGFGLAVNVAVGGAIFTVAVLVVLPPIPVAVRVYVVLVEGDTAIDPLSAVLPIAGLKLTDEASLAFHVRVLDAPRLIIAGLAVKVAGGGSGAYNSNSETMNW